MNLKFYLKSFFYFCRYLTSTSIIALVIILGVVQSSYAQTIFAQLTGAPVNITGWTLSGAATVGNVTGTGNSEINVCPYVFQASQAGGIFYNQPINLSTCNQWSAEFDFRIYDGTGADGLAFCFLDAQPSGAQLGGGMGIPPNANGLKVIFDTYDNCLIPNTTPKIEIRWGIGYSDLAPSNNGECATSYPTVDNSVVPPSVISSPNYNHAKINYSHGNIDVYINNVLYVSGYQQFNFSGYIGFTASEGGITDNHSIKNVTIYTNAVVAPTFTLVPSICSGTLPPILPATSNEGITGTWSPAVINNTTTGTYTFTPNLGQCAIDTTITLSVLQPSASTTSIIVCAASLPYSWNSNSYNSGGVYNVTLVNTVGCDSIATLDLTVSSIVTPSFSLPNFICRGTLAPTLPAISNEGITGTWSPAVIDNTTTGIYTFTPNSGQCAVNTTINITVLQTSASMTSIIVCPSALPYSWNGNSYSSAGIYTVTLSNTAGCDSVATLNLAVSTSIAPTFTIAASLCSGTPPPTLPAISNEGITGTWSPAIVDNTTTGTYTFTPNAGQCALNTTIIVTVLQPTASTTSVTVCPSMLPYNWNGSSYSSAGIYTIILTNLAGCDSVATLNLAVSTSIAPTFTIAASLCSGTSPSTLPTISNEGITGTWSPAIVDNTTTGNYTFISNLGQCAVNKTITVTVLQPTASTTSLTVCPLALPYTWNGSIYSSAGSYTITIANVAGCDSVATLDLAVSAQSYSTISQSICLGQSYLGYTAAGTYVDTLVAANGCDSIRTLNLTLLDLPAPNLGPDQQICEGDTIVLTPGTFLSYLWQDNSTADNFIVTKPGIYSVAVSNNTCGSSDAEIEIFNKNCNEYFPSAFTPNGDGKNDYFRILNASNLTNYSLTIYNRWGEIVFQTNDYSKGWDGTVKGQPQSTAIFVYLCRYKKAGNAMLAKGTITLIR